MRLTADSVGMLPELTTVNKSRGEYIHDTTLRVAVVTICVADLMAISCSRRDINLA